jgi:predicted metalloprotease with PDZ domain
MSALAKCGRTVGVCGAAMAVLFLAMRTMAQNPPGPIRLAVDATSAPQKILHAVEEIPVHAGPLTLFYPLWIPGEHAPDGPITDLAGLEFSVNGTRLSWRRDLVDTAAFHLDVPAGADTLTVTLDFLLSAPASGFSAGASATAQLDVLSWNQVLLYPKGWPVRELTFEPSLKIPADWKFGTALPVESESGGEIVFKPVQLNTLVDSPVLAGLYFRAIQLTPGQTPSHEIDMAADSAEALDMPEETQEEYKRLVAETGALFGSRHYRDYHFLLTLSDNVAHFGLEHHESSDDRVDEKTMVDPSLRIENADLLPHEFTHSWNGKYRRPAGLATPDYNTPMKTDLLWVYEGLTQYLSQVLAARSGLWTPDEMRERLAVVAATLDYTTGREWRSLQDTADAAPLLYFAAPEWQNWRRGTDFYDEGTLVWLDVDTTIRKITNDKKSLNDFCRLFHGGPGGEPALKTFTFDDVVASLNQVAPYDWTKFLRDRLDNVGPHAPLGGIENGGYQLVYNDTPNDMLLISETNDRYLDLTESIGLVLEDDGTIRDVIHGMMAYNAGIGPGMRIQAVNGRGWSMEAMRRAVADSEKNTRPIKLVIANGDFMETYTLDYHSGIRYPHLARQSGGSDYLDEIIQPLTPASQSVAAPRKKAAEAGVRARR